MEKGFDWPCISGIATFMFHFGTYLFFLHKTIQDQLEF